MVALLDPRRPLALGLGYLKKPEHWPELLWRQAWEKKPMLRNALAEKGSFVYLSSSVTA